MPQLLNRPKPYLLAHRGAPDCAPENTLGSFRLALTAEPEIVETDLWFTRDGELVCHHDPTVERMTGQPGRLSDMTLREVQALPIRSRFDAEYPDEHIPSLAEVLDFLPLHVLLGVELKDPKFAEPAWAGRLVRQVADRVAAQEVVALSFHRRHLDGLKRAEPAFPTGYLAVYDPRPPKSADVLGPFWPLLLANPRYVATAHDRGQWVCPLDPDAHRRLGWYFRLGVDAVMSNHPVAMRNLLEQHRQASGG